MKRIAWQVLLTALLLSGGNSVRADVIFQTGNNPQPNEENVLLSSGATGTTVTGLTNMSNILVNFSSPQTLSEPSSGQARVAAASPPLTNVTISIPGGSFEDVILNPFDGSGIATVTALANEPGGGQSTFTFTYTLANGENFLTVTADNGESLVSVTIDDPKGFSDLRQPRISGASLEGGGGGGSVPEPSSVVLSGLGALGLLAYGWRKQRARA
jgi:hypothetical protein